MVITIVNYLVLLIELNSTLNAVMKIYEKKLTLLIC